MNHNIYIQNGELDIILKSNKNRFWPKFRLRSLRIKLYVSYLSVGILTALFFSVTFLNSIQDYYSNEQKNKYLNTANVLSTNISKTEYIVNDDIAGLKREIQAKSKEGGYRIIVVDSTGMCISDSNGVFENKYISSSELYNALAGNDNSRIHKDEESVYAATSIVGKDSNITGAVLIVASIKDTFTLIDELQKQMLFYLLILAIVIMFAVVFISQFFLSPLVKILKVIEKMSDGHLNQRIELKSDDEFMELAEAFNDMAVKLEEVEQTRDEFVSNVSHELKTPLSSIKVLSESILLEDNVEKEMYVEFLEDINSEIDRMTNIVNDLLTLVKLDKSEIVLNISRVDVEELLNSIIKRLRPLANQKNIVIRTDIPKDVYIEADAVKLSLALSNVIENAIKYTYKGGSVDVTAVADNHNLYVTVKDTGIGMDEAELNKIFTRFYRVDKTRDRETGGTGLGLSITHSTILLHNGSIRVSSKEDEGTVFLIRVPLKSEKSESNN